VTTFFAPERPIPGTSLTLGADVAHHARVRRLAVGERVSLTDGDGTLASGTIIRLGKKQVVVDVEAAESREPPDAVHLLLPVADRDRMLWLAEKITELAASSWRPVIWRRSRSVSPRGEGTTFHGKVRGRMIAALEQSGGAWLPAMYPEATLERAIIATPPGTRLLLDPAGPPLLSRWLTLPVSLAIGPEGGIEPEERTALITAGWTPVSIGRGILRFETAAVAALAVTRAALERRMEEHRD
jgi:16S rRNA (uracil1498-N3)-methyltransferase